MPGADGNLVKVYLYGYKLASEGRAVDHRDIANLLGIFESDVERAWTYWENMGIIEKVQNENSYDVVFLSIRRILIENIYKVSTVEEEPFTEILSDPVLADLFSKAEFYMRREISPMKKRDIASWITTYNMTPEIIIEAFFYSCEIRNVYDLKYVEGVLKNWEEKNIRTKDEIEKSYREYDQDIYRYRRVMRKIGLQNKPFNQVDLKIINSWYDEYNFTDEMVDIALERVSSISNPNLNYFDSILKNWHLKNIKTPEEIVRDKKPTIPKNVNKTRFHNFKERSGKLTNEDYRERQRKMMENYLEGGVDES